MFKCKIIISLILLFNSVLSYSQQASIYGIPFGSTFSKVGTFSK